MASAGARGGAAIQPTGRGVQIRGGSSGATPTWERGRRNTIDDLSPEAPPELRGDKKEEPKTTEDI